MWIDEGAQEQSQIDQREKNDWQVGEILWKSNPKNRCMVNKLFVSYFESRGNCGAFECDSGRRLTSAIYLIKLEKIVQIGGLARLECFVGD